MSEFSGFPKPKRNYSQLPHALIDMLPEINSLSELKVVLYILRHTWGYSEFGKPKRMTTDEFIDGRKRADGSRCDDGTGLSKHSVINGLREAEAHGFIVVDVDDHDKGRIKKYYRIKMNDGKTYEPDPQELDADVQKLHSDGAEVAQRTEKETIERNKERVNARDSTPVPFHFANGLGLVTKTKKEVDVRTAKAHPVWQAYVRGWDGVEPDLPASTIDTTLDALNELQKGIAAGQYTLADIEALTRKKLSEPRAKTYLLIYLKSDLPPYIKSEQARRQRDQIITQARVPEEWGVNQFVRQVKQ